MKLTCISRILFPLCLMSCFLESRSQQLPSVIPTSPQAMDLAKYINYPVNYSTGLPDISIPLYEIKVDGLTLPISISYHASGLKGNQPSGWVGYGWSLNAEPAISRSIKGSADDKSSLTGYLKTDFKKLFGSNGDHSSIYQEFMNYWSMGLIDAEPDEFYYRLAGKSGKFYFTRDFNSALELLPLTGGF